MFQPDFLALFSKKSAEKKQIKPWEVNRHSDYQPVENPNICFPSLSALDSALHHRTTSGANRIDVHPAMSGILLEPRFAGTELNSCSWNLNKW